MKLISPLLLIFFIGTTSIIAQNTISGKISDEKKVPLTFANILLHEKGSKESRRECGV